MSDEFKEVGFSTLSLFNLEKIEKDIESFLYEPLTAVIHSILEVKDKNDINAEYLITQVKQSAYLKKDFLNISKNLPTSTSIPLPPSSLREAGMFLDNSWKQTALLTTCFYSLLNQHHKHPFIKIWQRYIDIAKIAVFISRACVFEKNHFYYLFAIFADCGIPIMHHSIANYGEVYYNLLKINDRAYLKLEEECFGINHQHVGFCFGNVWRLPSEVSWAILSDHKLDAPIDVQTEKQETKNRLISVTQIAREIYKAFLKHPKESLSHEILPKISTHEMMYLKVNEAEFEDIIDHCFYELSSILEPIN